MVTFYVATYGLETSVDEVLTEEEFFARPAEGFEPNRHWFKVNVRTSNDMERWVKAYNNMLFGQWTPNQTPSDKEYYGKMIEAAKEDMTRLEVDEDGGDMA